MTPVGTDALPAKMANEVLLPVAPGLLGETVLVPMTVVVSKMVLGMLDEVTGPVARAPVPLMYVPFVKGPFENTPLPYAVAVVVLLVALLGVM